MVYVSKHYKEIDVFKGLAILLIVFGHSFCLFPVDFRETSLINAQHLIGTFNLNMFFLASGVLFSVRGTWGDFFLKKLSRLMLPWLVFSVAELLLKTVMSAYVHHPAGNFGQELLKDVVYGKSYWFLYALFLMMIITKVLKEKRWFLGVIGGALILCLPLTQYIPDEFDLFCAKRFIHYYPWFLMGFLIKDNYATISETVQTNSIKSFASALSLFVVMIVLVMTSLSHQFVIKYYIMPVLGCLSFYLLSTVICSQERMEKGFSFFGKYSLQYYLNHLLIMLACYYLGALLFDFSPFLSLIVIFISAIIISSIMLWVEMKMPKPIRNVFGFL